MAAPTGNQFWKQRSQHGPHRIFGEGDADRLRDDCSSYFNWCDAHPWWKNEAIKSGDRAGTTMKIETARPYTISGLCIYLGINERTWRKMRTDVGTPKDIIPVIQWADQVIETQQFEGAAVGAFNANIIATKQGLAQKIEQRNVDKDGNDVQPVKQVFHINGKDIEFS